MHRGQDGKDPPGVLVKGSHSRVGGKTVGDAGDAGRKGPVDGDSKKTLMQRLPGLNQGGRAMPDNPNNWAQALRDLWALFGTGAITALAIATRLFAHMHPAAVPFARVLKGR